MGHVGVLQIVLLETFLSFYFDEHSYVFLLGSYLEGELLGQKRLLADFAKTVSTVVAQFIPPPAGV